MVSRGLKNNHVASDWSPYDFVGFLRGTPYYITPSDDIIAGNICSFKQRLLLPCRTLAATATISYHNFGGNFTLFFSPGSYVVQNINLNFRAIQMVTLRPLDETVGTIRLNCLDNMTITFRHVDKITVRSIEFYSSGEEYKRVIYIKFALILMAYVIF